MSFPLLKTGQMAVTNAAAALPTVLPAESSTATTFGMSFRIRLKALKANAASVFYGPAGVTTATGDELAPGESATFDINDLALVFVIAAAGGGSVSWAVTNTGQ